MPRRHPTTSNKNKRRLPEWGDGGNNNNAEEIVDDLAHAATFAMMTMVVTTVPGAETKVPPIVDGDYHNEDDTGMIIDDKEVVVENDDIEIEESASSSSEEDESENQSGEDNGDDGDYDDDDDDDQSDVDLAEALAGMDPDGTLEEEEEEDEYPSSASNNKVPRPPKTENELDAYRTPIQELEKHLQFQLSVDPEAVAGTAGTGSTNAREKRRITASNLQLAGRIKHFMTFDRTVVVESAASNPHGDATSFRNEKAPLDEGTLLFLRGSPESSSNANRKNSQDNGATPGGEEEQLIPLGRIFEVFGPVSQPLYTIRLPSYPVEKKKVTSTKPTKAISRAQEKGDAAVPTTAAPDDAGTPPVDLEDKNCESNKDEVVISQQEKFGAVEAEGQSTGHTVRESSTSACEIASVVVEQGVAISTEMATSSPEETDPWAPNGLYVKLLQQSASLPVYYVRDEAKLIDTGFIMKMSRKGCDASNLYDEEVLNANEMYYSDDEEERQAKNRRKSKGSSQQQGQRGVPTAVHSGNDQSPSLPTGFHSADMPASQRKAPSAGAALPQGFHQPTPANQGRPFGVQPLPPGQRPRHNGMPPAANRAFSYPMLHGAPPPPPPPGSSAPPPAYQY